MATDMRIRRLLPLAILIAIAVALHPCRSAFPILSILSILLNASAFRHLTTPL
jgi:hypothetical protein